MARDTAATTRLEKVDAAIASTATSLGGMQTAIASTATSLGGMQTAIASTATRLDGMQTAIANTAPRLDGMQTDIANTASRLDGMQSAIANMATRSEKVESENRDLKSKVHGLELMVNDLKVRFGVIETTAGNVETGFPALAETLEDVKRLRREAGESAQMAAERLGQIQVLAERVLRAEKSTTSTNEGAVELVTANSSGVLQDVEVIGLATFQERSAEAKAKNEDVENSAIAAKRIARNVNKITTSQTKSAKMKKDNSENARQVHVNNKWASLVRSVKEGTAKHDGKWTPREMGFKMRKFKGGEIMQLGPRVASRVWDRSNSEYPMFLQCCNDFTVTLTNGTVLEWKSYSWGRDSYGYFDPNGTGDMFETLADVYAWINMQNSPVV